MKRTLCANEALMRLVQGNARFVNGICIAERIPRHIKRKTAFVPKGQNPFAIVLTCSDSRVPVEMVFDCELGDIFVIRVAGNVVETSLVASIEYACQQLDIKLCIVMGHTECGAVQAATNRALTNDVLPTENLNSLIRHLVPAVEKVIDQKHLTCKDKIAELAVEENVNQSIKRLHVESPYRAGLVEAQQLTFVGAVYNTESGKVNLTGLDDRFRSIFDQNSQETYQTAVGH